MGQMYAFHATAIGHHHVMRGKVCQDASVSFQSEDGEYQIAVIADGHGDALCFRSDKGSEIATKVALECLQQFAEKVHNLGERFYQDITSNPRYQQMIVKELTDTIIAKWHDSIMEHYDNHQLTEEELKYDIEYGQNKEQVAHIYGTTLLAALRLPYCLILLQQGDGRCEVFYDDGTVNQPVPWDERCEDTITTSMCDKDAALSIRNCVIDLKENNVIACYLGCDGVEDAYRDSTENMEGVHIFYKNLTCQLAKMTPLEFQPYLLEMLSVFSEKGLFSQCGSGDDVSVAGIVDLERIPSFVDEFQMDIKKYELNEALFWKMDALRGKTRKHGILQKRMKESEDTYREIQKTFQSLNLQLQELLEEEKTLKQQKQYAKKNLDIYKETSEEVKEYVEGNVDVSEECQTFIEKFKQIINIPRFYAEIVTEHKSRERMYKEYSDKLIDVENQIQSFNKKKEECLVVLKEAESKFQEARVLFDEYDNTFQTIQTECELIQAKIDSLSLKTAEL